MAQLVLCFFTALVLAQDVSIAPVRTYYVAPVYSAEARAAGAKGTVVIEATIDERGAVAEAHVVRSVALLDQAALDAVKQWRYNPTSLNGRPVRTIATVSVRLPIETAPFDLTGTWRLMSYALGAGIQRVDGAFGEGFIAMQTPLELTVDAPSLHTGRGGMLLPPIHVTYRFDGSKTNGDMIISTGSTSRSWDTTSWVGDRLQILKHWQNNLPEHISFQVELWRDADGTIIAERTDNPSGGYLGTPSITWRARYQRVDK